MEIRVRSTGQIMSESEWRKYILDNSGPTFDQITTEILDLLGADIVFEGPQPVPQNPYQTAMRNSVELVSGKWQWVYILGPVFQSAQEEAEYKQSVDAVQSSRVRDGRNRLLSQCDWTQVADAPVDKQAWATYRQALRDITNQPGFPWDLTWPEPPQGTA